MANINRLKAWVRYDGKGRLVGGGPITQEHKPKDGDWEEIPYYSYCCQEGPTTTSTTSTTTSTTTAAPATPGFRMLFNNISSANTLVGDATNLADWNTFFDLPVNGSPFTNVIVQGNEVYLYGGYNIQIRAGLMMNTNSLIEISDDLGYITSILDVAFYYNTSLISAYFPEVVTVAGGAFGNCETLTAINFPKLVSIGEFCFNDTFLVQSINLPLLTTIVGYAFRQCGRFGGVLTTISLPSLTSATGIYNFLACSSIEVFNLPLLQTAGDLCFAQCYAINSFSLPSCVNVGSSVGNNDVFDSIFGRTITLTIPASRMTCNGGGPDGDISALQGGNSVTVITT